MSGGERLSDARGARSRALAAWAAGALAVIVAAGLRGLHLPAQLLTGDELHAVRAAGRRPVGEILRTWSFEGADYSVPLTALVRLLGDRGVALSELDLRLPGLAAGLVAVVLLPALLRPRIGRAGALTCAWLLAVSPLLVLYSRIVRSYMPMVLLAAVAVLAFDRWWRGAGPRSAVVFAASGALAVYLHLGAAPFLGGALLFGAVDLARTRLRRAETTLGGLSPGVAWRRLAAAGAGLAAASAVLLLPAAGSLLALEARHGAGRLPDLATWGSVALLLVGTPRPAVAVAMLAALAWGGLRLTRRDPGFALHLGCLAAAHVAGLALLSPNWLQDAVVASRYLLVLVPFALAVLAVGLTSLPGPALRVAVPALALVALVATGPFASPAARGSSFLHAPPFGGLVGEYDTMDPEAVPAIYRDMAASPEPGAVLEAPWVNSATHAFRAYQRVHGRELRVVPAVPANVTGPRWSFRNVVAPTAEAVLGSDARWLVIHDDLREEEARVRTAERLHARRLAEVPALWATLRAAAARLDADVTAALGEPDWRDPDVRVWDLEAARRARRPGAEGAPEAGATRRPEAGA